MPSHYCRIPKYDIALGEFPYQDPKQPPCPSMYIKALRELADLELQTYHRDQLCYRIYEQQRQQQQRQQQLASRLTRPRSSHGRIDSSRVRHAEEASPSCKNGTLCIRSNSFNQSSYRQ